MNPTFTRGARLGRYTLVAPLGAGGTAEVWEAVLTGPHGFARPVALKLFRSAPEVEPAALAEEARLGGLVSHPNVVATYDFGEIDGVPYLALELVRGASLAELLERGPLPGRAVIELGVQVAAGLQHLHELRIAGAPASLVHRDVKPGNVLVDRSGVARLADLGTAHWARSVAGWAGTPGFMAPEQARGRPEPRSDLFALGVVLYLSAVGRMPFIGRHTAEAARFLEDRLRDPAFLGPLDEAAPGLGGLVAVALRYDPADRFPSARAMVEALTGLRSRVPAGSSLLEVLARHRPDLRIEAPGALTEPTLRSPLGNLPPPRDRFFGRAEERAGLRDRVQRGERLVTLVGPGGVGKTRLALEVARELAPEHPGGSWFVDLAEARSVDDACVALGRSLGIDVGPGDPVEQLGHALHARDRVLVVLDNFEQLVATTGAAEAVARWVERAPTATLLVTSRAALRARGEVRVAVGPLPPADGADLFLDRAPRTISACREDVEALAAELEGLPLALELAAARAAVMGVDALRRRLSDRLRLLAGPADERPTRHHSLRASLDASWDLLKPWEQAALAQLTVFDGGFTLEAAEAVLDLAEWAEAPWAVDVVSTLADASLLWYDGRADRFRMLVVVQEWAAERLDGPAARRAEVRHGEWASALGDDAVLEGIRQRGTAALRGLQAEVDNLVAALRRAIAREDPEVAARAALAAAAALRDWGPAATEAELLGQALASSPPLPLRVGLSCALAGALRRVGRAEEGQAAAARAVGAARELGSVRWEARALAELGQGLIEQGRLAEAEEKLELGLSLACAAGDAIVQIDALTSLANQAIWTGALGDAEVRLEEALRLVRSAGDLRGEARVFDRLGALAFFQGSSEARRHMERALELRRAIGDRRGEAASLVNLGASVIDRGQLEEARRLYVQALSIWRELGHRPEEAILLASLGSLCIDEGRPDEAIVILNQALAVHRAAHQRWWEGVVLGTLGAALRLLGEDDEARRHLQEALAVTRETGNRRSEAVALVNLGLVDRSPEEVADAVRVARSSKAHAAVGPALGYLALLHLEAGDRAAARDAAEAAVDALGAGGGTSPRRGAVAWVARAVVALADGDLVAAGADLDAAGPEVAAGLPESRVVLLCARTELAHARGEPVQPTLQEVEGLTAHLPERSPLRRRVAATRSRVEPP